MADGGIEFPPRSAHNLIGRAAKLFGIPGVEEHNMTMRARTPCASATASSSVSRRSPHPRRGARVKLTFVHRRRGTGVEVASEIHASSTRTSRPTTRISTLTVSGSTS